MSEQVTYKGVLIVHSEGLWRWQLEGADYEAETLEWAKDRIDDPYREAVYAIK
jgi:hypothetical protein